MSGYFLMETNVDTITNNVHDTPIRPSITGLSPKEGVPGTQIKIRGENLGNGQSDILVLSICGTDCLMSARWKSPSLIVARVGQAKRGVGEVILVTKSLGRSVSSVTFRVFIVQVGPLEESAVWIDESRTVPGREAVRNIPETIETVDALGLPIEPQKKMEKSALMQMFPEGSGNLRMENFNPAWFLLENHRETSLSDLRRGLESITKSVTEEDSNADIHRANLYALISCVDALAECHSRMELEKNTRGWPLTQTIYDKLTESSSTANGLFFDVLTRKDRADATRNALSVLTRFRLIFFLPSAIDHNLSKGEYSMILNDYARAKSLFKDTDVPLFKEVMNVLEAKMEIFKKNMKKRLIDMPTSFEDQSKLIKYLKVLEPDSDPAWDCITAYHCWLEDLLWQTQFKHYEMVVDGHDHSRLEFVESMVRIITDKLQTFWKLSQVYSASSTNQNYVDRQFDINQMLINTINVSSWLMLNALVPSSLPEAVITQYKEQFVEWPVVAFNSMFNQLFSSLKVLRNCISTMLDSNFTNEHLQPLIELSITIRLKCLSNVIEKTSEGVSSLTSKENWKLEQLPKNVSKTVLPDLFENELNDALPSVKQILSYSGFAGELDLFSRDAFRPILSSLFISMITSVRDCIRHLLQFRSDSKRPTDLSSSKITSKKLLISVCNMEYIVNNSLPTFCKRLSDNGVKYGDLIFEESKARLLAFRRDLIKYYLQMKCAAFSSLIDSAVYSDLCCEGNCCLFYNNASPFIKELIMCLMFIQSEVCLLAPHLSQEILSPAVQNAFVELLLKLDEQKNLSAYQATQLVVDVSALEECLQDFLSLQTRSDLNAFRARFLKLIDQQHFQACLREFRSSMRMAIASFSCIPTNSLNETSEV
uniref:Exocyst complex component 2 n=1 Tax=Syphacia muris TaxID=451379 RepID=A0A0N5AA74_9BILA